MKLLYLPRPFVTPEIAKMIPALRTAIRPRSLKLRNPEGVKGKLDRLSGLITILVRDERIEHTYSTVSEARDYAERLIAEAIQHGDCHQPTMELADFWLKEKQLVHKLFKELAQAKNSITMEPYSQVLVPRYRDSKISYTKMYRAPMPYPASGYEGSKVLQRKDLDQAVLELRNNPLLPIAPRPTPTRNWIHNVLLEEARREYKLQKGIEAELAMQQCMHAEHETNPDEEID